MSTVGAAAWLGPSPGFEPKPGRNITNTVQYHKSARKRQWKHEKDDQAQ